MRRSLSLGRSLAEALAFVPRAWVDVWAALTLFMLVVVAPNYLPRPADSAWLLLVWVAAFALTGLALQGGLLRIGVTRSLAEARSLGFGFGGLQLGAAEARLVISAVLVVAFLGLVALGLMLVAVFAALAGGANLWIAPQLLIANLEAGRPGAWVPALIWVAVGVILLQLAVRLALFKPATVARRKRVSLDALALSEGAFWKLCAGLIVTLAPTAALAVFALYGLGHHGVQPSTYGLISAAVMGLLQAPFSIGFLSSAYRQLEYH